MALLIIITSVIVLLTTTAFYFKLTNAMCTSKKRLDGKTVLVTGGTAGMGLEIATELARRGAKTIIACPFKDEGEQAREQIVQATGNKQVFFKLLDLASFKSVRSFAADIKENEGSLHILVNNAGVGIPEASKTSDGVDFIIQVNYLGHFLLTMLLLPLLKKAGTKLEPSRIVCTSSFLHLIGRPKLNTFKKPNFFQRIFVYGDSKFCFIPFTRELTKKLTDSHIVANNVDPGFVGTRIFQSSGALLGYFLGAIASLVHKTPRQGAQTAIHVSLDDEAGKTSGQMYRNCRLCRAKAVAYSDKVARDVWEQSVNMSGITAQELEECL